MVCIFFLDFLYTYMKKGGENSGGFVFEELDFLGTPQSHTNVKYSTP